MLHGCVMQNAWQQNIPLSRQVQYFNDTRAKMVAAVGSAAAVDALLARSMFPHQRRQQPLPENTKLLSVSSFASNK